MATDTFASNHTRAFILSALVVLLAAALTLSSINYQRPNDPLCKRLGAGFPLAFICDASGESPLSSVGRIDRADIDSINFTGSVMDLLFYALILWAGLLLWQRLSERRRRAAQEDLVAHAVQYRLAALTQPNSPQDHRQSQYLHADKRDS